jgi:acetolactate synthase-1/2/3 large subunit
VNGAELIIQTAREAGVGVCFANFGTTEMPLALALAAEPGIKPVLALSEGVCTGAADGFGRMRQKPAMTLLHLGPGLANGLSNLHNAKKAHAPVLNLVGQHQTQHVGLDPPLAMDIESLASTVGWYRNGASPEGLSRDLAEAYAASLYGQVATLSIPNDVQHKEAESSEVLAPRFSFDPVDEESVREAARLLKAHGKTALFLGGRALRRTGLLAAARLRALSGCALITDYLPGCLDRGAGLPEVTLTTYFPEPAIELLSGYEAVVLAGAKQPVSFFGYEGIRGELLPDGQPRVSIAGPRQDPVEALEWLADLLGAPEQIDQDLLAAPYRPAPAKGELTGETACRNLAAVQPEGAVIVHEGISAGFSYPAVSSGLPPHSLLTVSGGSIGYGMPCSVGAAIACPERPVINLQADGSAMYTVQALWTQAKQNLNVTTLICANRCYNILKVEMRRAGIESFGPAISSLVDMENPHIDWVGLSQSLGVPAVSVSTGEQLVAEIGKALDAPGPHLIEMVLATAQDRSGG